MNRSLLLLLGLLTANTLLGQIDLRVIVESGSASSDCTDGPFGGDPDPLFAVAVEGTDYRYYPDVGICFNSLPDTSFTQSYACPSEVPATVEVCLQVTENDDIFQPPLGCEITESCTETICADFALPLLNDPAAGYTLNIDAPGSSSGEVNFRIELTGFAFPDNDFICNAFDLGVLGYGDTLNDMTLGNFSNICGTDINEPNPQDIGAYFTNQAGVWFTFTTGADHSGLVVLEGLSDPQGTGEAIDLEMAIFTSDNGACDGNLAEITDFQFINGSFDHELRAPCLAPNTTYYILVDGANNMDDFQGIFGLQVWDPGVAMGGDLRCDAIDLGVVPEGGSVMTDQPYSNFCGTDAQDPFLPIFVSQHSVWFSFTAPPSGHVIINAVSDTEKAPIDIQLALYRSFNNTCTGFYSYVTGQFTPADLDEEMEVTCLFPNRVYYLLVDGGAVSARGIFEITVTDAGDITPRTEQEVTLCDGESLNVGFSTYTTSGMYADTLTLFQGCDSIVFTDLTVLPPLELTVEQTQPAIGEDGTNGIGMASAVGGDGNYTFNWCNGDTGPNSTNLVAGEECCVQVTDSNGCTDEVCFTVDFTTAIIPVFANDTLACFGDNNGVLEFSASEGVAPYDYTWTNSSSSLFGDGQIATEGGSAQIENLPAGNYEITINDAFLDTTFTVMVVQPNELVVGLDEVTSASCFGFCDGSISVLASGGTPPYSYAWNNVVGSELLAGLCSGVYNLVVTDDNGCEATLSVNVEQPPAFLANATAVQDVSCFNGNDGIAEVTTNGNPVAWEWSSGSTTGTATDLSALQYSVTVTNNDGCMDTTTVIITQPIAPLIATIDESTPVSCFGEADGTLSALVDGPFASLSYNWSNGASLVDASGLIAGSYAVTVTNEAGCEAMASYTLNQPTEIIAEVFTTDINCVDGDNSGVITIESVSGGTPGYTFSNDGSNYISSPIFEGLAAGNYDIAVRDARACELKLNANIFPPPPIDVVLTANINDEENEIKLGDIVTIIAETGTTNGLFRWSHADTLSGSVAIVQPTSSFIYEVSVIDTLTMCTASDLIQIFVNTARDFYVPNIFSPNNDGTNDVFVPQAGADVTIIRSLRIFSRGGQLVYEANNLLPGDSSRGWDGSFQGEDMNPATFVYFAEVEYFDGQVELFKGSITLIR